MRRSTLLVAAATTGAAAVLVRLAAWQWDRGRSSGAVVHYTYAVEWVLLAGALVTGAVVAGRRGRATRPAEAEQGCRDVHGRVIGPPLRAQEPLEDTTPVRLRRRLPGRRRAAQGPRRPSGRRR